MNDKLVYSSMVPLYNKELVIDESYRRIKEETGVLDFFVGMILMFVDIVKAIFNKEELMNFTMMMGINMMMFGVTLGFIGVVGQYIGRIFDESKGKPI